MCFGSNLSKGLCDLSEKQTDIPSPYSYFNDKTLGGYLYADYCPVAKYDNDAENDMFFSSSCAIGILNYPDLGETIGTDSGCFMSSLVQKSNKNYDSLKDKKRAICYYYKCNSADQSYTVSILDKTISCNKEGGVKTVEGFDGGIQCPDYHSICTKNTPCKDVTDCALKKVAYEFPNLNYTINTNDFISSTKPNAGFFPFVYVYLIAIIYIVGMN